MEDQSQQTTTIDQDGLRTYFEEYGRLAFVAHQHQAQLAKLQQMREVSGQLLADHGPEKCVPVAAVEDDGDTEPGG